MKDLRYRISNLTLNRQDSVECGHAATWNHLASRPGAWKQQLYIKGRRLTAANVWLDMLANQLTPEETAEEWNLPLEAIEEIVRYCETNRPLIAAEAAEEKQSLQDMNT